MAGTTHTRYKFAQIFKQPGRGALQLRRYVDGEAYNQPRVGAAIERRQVPEPGSAEYLRIDCSAQ